MNDVDVPVVALEANTVDADDELALLPVVGDCVVAGVVVITRTVVGETVVPAVEETVVPVVGDCVVKGVDVVSVAVGDVIVVPGVDVCELPVVRDCVVNVLDVPVTDNYRISLSISFKTTVFRPCRIENINVMHTGQS